MQTGLVASEGRDSWVPSAATYRKQVEANTHLLVQRTQELYQHQVCMHALNSGHLPQSMQTQEAVTVPP